MWEITRERISPMKLQINDKPGPGHYETFLKNTSNGGTGFSFSREMRCFDKIAREELRNAIKYKEQDYVSQYAKMQLQFKQKS